MVMPDHAFWRGKSVFVTGHTGFKGAWLSLWLTQMGAKVTGFSLPDALSEPSLFDLAVKEGVTHIKGDLRDAQAIADAVNTAQPDIVFHMAAQSLVRESYKDPIGTYATNVMGSLHLFEAVRHHAKNCKAIVNVTSDKCYQNNNWHWAYRETDPMGGHDPYSSSKGCADFLASSYRASYFQDSVTDKDGVALGTVRAGNVIGGGDWAADRLVPDCIRSFYKSEAVIIRSPHATRPWQHVLDPLCGYIMLAEKLYAGKDRASFAQAWNFGPTDDDAKPVEYIVSEMVRLWGGNASWKLDKDTHPYEAKFLKVDSSKAKAELHWQHKLPVEQALAWSVEWYKAQANGADAKKLCLDQIARYEQTENGTHYEVA